MVVTCFCHKTYCSTKHDPNGQAACHTFRCPRNTEIMKLWQKSVPTKNGGGVFDVDKSRLCTLHFEDKYLIKRDSTTINGVISSLPRQRWALRADAVPTIFCQNVLKPINTNKVAKKRKFQDSTGSENSVLKLPKLNDSVFEETDHVENGHEPEINLKNKLKSIIVNDVKCIRHPPQWSTRLSEDEGQPFLVIFELVPVHAPTSGSLLSLDIVRLVQISHDMQATIQVRGKVLETKGISSVEDINDVIENVVKIHLCSGIEGFENISVCKGGVKSLDKWFSASCSVASKNTRCENCSKLWVALRVRKCRELKAARHRHENTPSSPSKSKAYYRQKFQKKKQQVIKLKAAKCVDRLTLKTLETKLKTIKEETMFESIDSCTAMPENLKSSVKEAVKVAIQKANCTGNGKHAVRYEPDWLLQCLLLKITSSKAYRFLRNNNVLPLPHETTLHRLIRGLPCSFGFSYSVMSLLSDEMKGKDAKSKHGALLFDEMKVTEALDFNKHDLTFRGFVDFGEESDSNMNTKAYQLADHALVLLYRPFNAAWFKGKVVSMAHYWEVHNLEKGHHTRVGWKITEAHLKPNPFQKMVVSLAVQLFSKSMSDAMTFYKLQNVKGLQNSDGTIDFTSSLNNLFDALNSRHPKDGMKLNSQQFQVVENFAELLSGSPDDNMFASPQTTEGLRVTLQSIMDLTKYLIEKVGFSYVLTAKFNQDVLEKFFGLIRSFNGDNDHPSITSFTYLFRLLSLYHPISNITKGNITSGENCAVSLTTFMNALKQSRHEVELKNREIREKLKSEITTAIVPVVSSQPKIHLLNHDYARAESWDCLIYQLCGFLAFRAKKFTSCKECAQTLCEVNQENCVKPEALLTNVKSLGKLSHPSDALFSVIKQIEPKIEEFVKQKNNLAGHFILKLVESFGPVNVCDVGCDVDGHLQFLLANVISYYLSIRMYFYSRIFNRESVVVRAKAKRDRKKVKLN